MMALSAGCAAKPAPAAVPVARDDSDGVGSEDALALLMGAEQDKPQDDDMSEEKLLRAFRTLDPNNNGYVEAEKIKTMKTCGGRMLENWSIGKWDGGNMRRK